MCRMVGKISVESEPIEYEMVKAPHSLLYMSENGCQPRGGRGTHGDGWGIAYKKEKEMKIKKSGNPMYDDDRFQDLSSQINTDLLLGSARLAAPGVPVSKENAHPFQKDELIFTQNGSVKEGLERENQSGTLDYLRWLSGNWNREVEHLKTLLEKAASSWSYTSISFLMTNGKKLYIFRQTPEEPERLDYYTLYTLSSEEKFIVASEPLDDRDWKLIENGTLIVVNAPDELSRISVC